MSAPREIVRDALTFAGPSRLPRDLWTLPWADTHHPETVAEIRRRWPSDFVSVPWFYRPSVRAQGDPYAEGTCVDAWGCEFVNIQAGLIGEVRRPILADWADAEGWEPPVEQLPTGEAEVSQAIEEIYRACAAEAAGEARYVFANICPQPWERYQFLRGTQNAMVDVLMPELGFGELMRRIHEFNLRELELWCRTDVDAIRMADDWGAQTSLLISPELWRALFAPLYTEYSELAHAHGKAVFLHSDGFIQDIVPDLIELGIDALNSQLFCMDLAELARVGRGKLTFWGEIDRQSVLPDADVGRTRAAVREVAGHLYDPTGGVIAQFEFGAGANPEAALAVFDEWEKVKRRTAS